ncbi:MAG: ABC transporter substrate binding protein [Chloroflexota bacterium]
MAATPEPQPVSEAQAKYTGKKILWVDSYHQGFEWTDGVEAGLHQVLDGTGVDLKILHMDTKQNPEEEFARQAGIQAKAEIEVFKPDIVIASEDNAQKYLVVPYLKGMDLPVVFTGVNWNASIYGYPASNVTGMLEVELPVQLIEHLNIYAHGNRIGFLTIDTETERKVAQIYNEQFFKGALKVYFVKTSDEFKQKFLDVQSEVDILIVGTNAGIDRWDNQEMENFILENTHIPTGAIYDWMAPYSLITLAKRPQEQGKWAGQTALKILDGVPVSQIPITENKEGDLILNLDMAEQLDIIFAPSMLRNAKIYGAERAEQ